MDMDKGKYLKLVALDIDSFEARIIDDKNVEDINGACKYFKNNYQKCKSSAVWLILPCNYSFGE